jgi:hypothetical protein
MTEPRGLAVYRAESKLHRKEAGAYWHRAGPHSAWDLVLVTQSGTVLFAGTDAKLEGVDALQYMNNGDWHRLPEPPGNGEKVGDGV